MDRLRNVEKIAYAPFNAMYYAGGLIIGATLRATVFREQDNYQEFLVDNRHEIDRDRPGSSRITSSGAELRTVGSKEQLDARVLMPHDQL